MKPIEWTEAIIDFMRSYSQLMSRKDMAAAVSKQFDCEVTMIMIKNAYRRYGINGRVTRFEQGNCPANKGVKGFNHKGFIPTQFKKDSKPHNTKPIGSERIADGYLQVKISETGYTPKDWRAKHIVEWEKLNGSLPRGHILRFIDGDKTNIAIDNLLLVTRSENAVMNRWLRINDLPEGGLLAVHLMAKIKIKISEKQRKGHHHA